MEREGEIIKVPKDLKDPKDSNNLYRVQRTVFTLHRPAQRALP